MGWPHGRHWREYVWNLGLQTARKCIFIDFSGNFIVYLYIQVSFMYVCKYLNQRVRRIGKYHGKFSKAISKTKKKKNMRLNFITQFKIEFLLLFAGCRKVLGKMPVVTSRNGDRKIMQSIKITSRPPLRIRKWNQLTQFRWTPTKLTPIERNYAGYISLMSQRFKRGSKWTTNSPAYLFL